MSIAPYLPIDWIEDPTLPGGMPCESCEQGESMCCLVPDLSIGELFAGYGGLGMGVQQALGGRVVWTSEFDAAPSRILKRRFPGVPNLGDITTIDWSKVPRVNVLTGGSPCQDLSHAGRRRGMTEGTRSNLWVAMREAIAVLRPNYVVWENVRGAFSTEADSDLGSDPGLLADVRRREGQPLLRALGRVSGDLSELGYDGRWHGLRAADVGAPHARYRVFYFATDTRGEERDRWPRLRPAGQGFGRGRPGDGSVEDGDLSRLLPTPQAHDAKGGKTEEQRREHREKTGAGSFNLVEEVLYGIPAPALLPTPQAEDANGSGGAASRADGRQAMLHDTVKLLPTPTGQDSESSSGSNPDWGHGVTLTDAARGMVDPELFPTPRATRGGSSTETTDALFPTPTSTDGTKGSPNQRDSSGRPGLAASALFPTPSVALAEGGQTSRSGDRKGEALLGGIEKLLPTPTTQDGANTGGASQLERNTPPLNAMVTLLPTPAATRAGGTPERLLESKNKVDGGGRTACTNLDILAAHADSRALWGDYAPAVARWEAVTGNAAPAPTVISPKTDKPQLSPVFVEWMMGLPAGWVTDPEMWHGMTNKKGHVLTGVRLATAARNAQLKALGNGVVPAQAEAALRLLLDPDLLTHTLPAPAAVSDDDAAEDPTW